MEVNGANDMNSIFEMNEEIPSADELAAARQDARKSLSVSVKRSLYTGTALVLCCVAIVPFSKGHSLHAHAEPYGRLLVYLAMGLFLVLVICTGLVVSSWMYVRDLEKAVK